MPGEGVRAADEPGQRGLEDGERGGEGCGGGRVERDVEVGAPWGGVGQGVAVEGLAQVVRAAQAGGGGRAGLVQEAGFVEGGERLADFGEMGVFGVQGGRELGSDDGDAGLGERVQGGVRIFEGGGEVAGVDADADAVVADLAERGDGVCGGLEGAAGFRFQADTDGAAGEFGEGVEAFREGDQGGQGGGRALVVVGGAPGERQGGDAAFGDVVGEERRRVPGPGRWCG